MIITLHVEFEVPFHEYDTPTKNNKAMAQIRRWIKDMFKERYIPLYIERDKSGAYWEDTTNGKIRVKIMNAYF